MRPPLTFSHQMSKVPPQQKTSQLVPVQHSSNVPTSTSSLQLEVPGRREIVEQYVIGGLPSRYGTSFRQVTTMQQNLSHPIEQQHEAQRPSILRRKLSQAGLQPDVAQTPKRPTQNGLQYGFLQNTTSPIRVQEVPPNSPFRSSSRQPANVTNTMGIPDGFGQATDITSGSPPSLLTQIRSYSKPSEKATIPASLIHASLVSVSLLKIIAYRMMESSSLNGKDVSPKPRQSSINHNTKTNLTSPFTPSVMPNPTNHSQNPAPSPPQLLIPVASDNIDAESVQHPVVKAFLIGLDSSQPASYLPAIEDIVIWITDGELDDAIIWFNAVTMLHAQLEVNDAPDPHFKSAGHEFHRALKCLVITIANFKWARDLFKTKGINTMVNSEYCSMERHYFQTKHGVDVLDQSTVDAETAQERDEVLKYFDTSMKAQFVKAEQNTRPMKLEERAGSALAGNAQARQR